MQRHWHNLRYWTQHKWYVFQECRVLRIPLWIALLHDWDKLLPDEWFPYVRFIHAPDDEERSIRRQAFVQAKAIHMRRNKHHWQYWVFMGDCGETECLPMPDVYRRELLADWRGAAKSLGKPDLLGWYSECRETMLFHSETRLWLEQQLGYTAN